jgi:hypothetical protein
MRDMPAGRPTDRSTDRSTDRRPFVYAGFDLAFAAIYVCIPLTFARTSDASFEIASGVAALLAILAAFGTLARREWGWWIAVWAAALLLVGTTVLLILLAMSAAYLYAVFGDLGRGATVIAILAMALAVEIYGLLPIFQLRYLLSQGGRAAVKRSS